MTTITAAKLDQILPNVAGTRTLDKFIAPMNAMFPRFGITTEKRLAGFIAQAGHESGEFQYMVENLNYSAQGLRKVFSKYFPTIALANQYARQPTMIASRVYANRMGNGDEASRDGWKFRGKGLIQITGRNNVTAFGKYLGKTVEETIAYLDTVEGCVVSAGWFWHTNGLNALADAGDLRKMTRVINGGYNGLEHRTQLYERAIAYL